MDNNKIRINTEIQLDEKIMDIVRTVHQQVIRFHEEYEAMNNLISLSSDIKKDELKLEGCVNKLKTLVDVCRKESLDLSRMSGMTSSPLEKGLYAQVLADIIHIVKDLEIYLEKISFILGTVINNNTVHNEKIKERIEAEFNMLHIKYNEFVRDDKDIISKLERLREIDPRPQRN